MRVLIGTHLIDATSVDVFSIGVSSVDACSVVVFSYLMAMMDLRRIFS